MCMEGTDFQNDLQLMSYALPMFADACDKVPASGEGAGMWRTTLAVFLIGYVVQAQVGDSSSTQTAPPGIDPDQIQGGTVEVIHEHSSFRRGTEEKIMLLPDVNPIWPRAELYWSAPRPKNGPFSPTELVLYPPVGFTVTRILYPQPPK